MSNTYTPPDRSTYDPGWNDPPPMPTVASLAAVPNKTRTNLNKRVAFPMQSAGATTTSNVKTTAEGLPLPFSTAKYQPPAMNTSPLPESTTVLSPPPPPTTIFNPSVPVPTTTTEPINETFDSAAARQLSHSVFTRLADAMATNSDVGKINEIRKRLETLDQMWQENKFDESVQKKLHELVKALENDESANAMEQHRLLVTQHINVSTQWATALRQIILSVSPESELDAQNAPATLSDTEVVQFVDVSSKPVVLDSIPPLPQEPASPSPSPLQQTNENTSNPSEIPILANSENESKSKFGRIGRILHL